MNRVLAFFAILLVAAALVAPSASAAPSSVDSAVAWLRTQQQQDGGFIGLNGKSDPGASSQVTLAFAVAGVNPATVSNGGKTLVDFLIASAGSYGATTGGAANLAIAAESSGLNPRQFGGQNLIETIKEKYDSGTGLYDPQLYVDGLAVLALRVAGESVPAAAVKALDDRQIADGSWAFDGQTQAGKGDSNTTSVVIGALAVLGQGSSAAVQNGRAYLAKAQTTDGSFVYQVGTENPPVGDANSTALGILALLASGDSAESQHVAQAMTALAKFQNADGAFYYRPDAKQDNLMATVQAIPALASMTLPVSSAASGAHGLASIAPATGVSRPSRALELVAAALALVSLAAGYKLRAQAK